MTDKQIEVWIRVFKLLPPAKRDQIAWDALIKATLRQLDTGVDTGLEAVEDAYKAYDTLTGRRI